MKINNIHNSGILYFQLVRQLSNTYVHMVLHCFGLAGDIKPSIWLLSTTHMILQTVFADFKLSANDF